ncbi:NrfD/PsrC family molybdoenzyme membrane anchor subunit, partial [Pseudomonas aeruginosa]
SACTWSTCRPPSGLAVLLGAYTGFLLSALKSYPFLNNPILPVLFLFSGISSGAAVALIAMAIRQRSNPHSTEAHFVHRMEIWQLSELLPRRSDTP